MKFVLEIELGQPRMQTLLHVSEAFGASCYHFNHAAPLQPGDQRTICDEAGDVVGTWAVVYELKTGADDAGRG